MVWLTLHLQSHICSTSDMTLINLPSRRESIPLWKGVGFCYDLNKRVAQLMLCDLKAISEMHKGNYLIARTLSLTLELPVRGQTALRQPCTMRSPKISPGETTWRSPGTRWRERCPASLQLSQTLLSVPLLGSLLAVSCQGLTWSWAPACSPATCLLYHSPCVICSTPWSSNHPIFKSIILCHYLSVKQISSITHLAFPPGVYWGNSFSIGLKPISTSPLPRVFPFLGSSIPVKTLTIYLVCRDTGVNLAPFFFLPLSSPGIAALCPTRLCLSNSLAYLGCPSAFSQFLSLMNILFFQHSVQSTFLQLSWWSSG